MSVLDRLKPGEETPWNGGVQHSCRTCGAVVDARDLAAHDKWHGALLVADAAATVVEAAALKLLDRMGAHLDPGAPSHKMFWEEFRKAIRR